MKLHSTLIAVNDLEKSIEFYKNILDQEVVLDLGWNKFMSGGFSIQKNFEVLLGIDKKDIIQKPNNMELYFEVDDFDTFVKKLEKYNVEYVHPPKKYDWQQRVVRIYDPDYHIIEIGESMKVIALRYLNEGYSVEQTAEIIQHPIEFVKGCIENNN
jgi:catechol 2,3-dioxygenase-like lactoylglutathione lyase family enzyme